jgi:2-alkyl-3-oxoalkanoate reductase
VTAALIALTGATGFIGKHLLQRLLTHGCNVRALTRGACPRTHTRLDWIRGTLADATALESLVANCDAVIHLAGAIRGGCYADFSSVNVDGTARLMAAVAARAPTAHVIDVSSLAAGEPAISWYAASKRASEEVVAASAERYSIVRPPAVYGADDPALAPVWRLLAQGWLLRPGPARARFSLLHVDDMTEALLRLVEHAPVENGVLTLHDGQADGYGWQQVADIAARQRGRPVRTVPVPRPLLPGAAGCNLAISRLMRRPPLLTPGKAAELSHPYWVCDNVAIFQTLNWAPAIRLEDRLETLPGWRRDR